MTTAGEFDRTVLLRSYTEATADGLGHRQKTFTDVRKCAARLWTRSAADQATAPGEWPIGTIQMLLYLPPSALIVGWQAVYKSVTYEITDVDHRDRETTALVTLVPV